MHDLLVRLAADGVTVLVSSHNLAEVQAVCSAVTVLARGTVRFSGPLADLPLQDAARTQLLRTSDDLGATRALLDHPAVSLAETSPAGLVLRAGEADLDSFVLALAAGGIAVRSLQQTNDPLVQAFLELTS